jgi:ribosomal-protein-alanine N-acetyltransferase
MVKVAVERTPLSGTQALKRTSKHPHPTKDRSLSSTSPSLTMPLITTRRIVLRAWRPGDAEALTAIYGDALSARYVEVPQPYDEGQANAFIQRAQKSRQFGTAFHYAITLPEQGTVVGSAYLHDCKPAEATTEVSYLIHPHDRGNGFATAALNALTDAALASGFKEVLARIAPTNRASEAVIRRVGFRLLRADTDETYWRKTVGPDLA